MQLRKLSNVAQVSVYGASEHNLCNLTIHFPQYQLIVVTGLSGSGKSSLAFDTLYAEGQYRYAQTFSSYARSFIGELRRPKVEKIEGLSPVIAIEQKTTHRNPRSTVGTSTEIYDFLRVLYAHIGQAYSNTGKMLQQLSEEDILHQLVNRYQGSCISLLSPLIRSRKGHYRELFAQLYKHGYTKVYVDGVLEDLRPKMQVDRFRNHNISVVIDHLPAKEGQRLDQAVREALQRGKGTLTVLESRSTKPVYFSTKLSDTETGVAFDVPAPNTFSFNTPQGACPRCKGLGEYKCIDNDRLIPNMSLSVSQGGISALGPSKSVSTFRAISYVLSGEGFSLRTPLDKLPENVLDRLLYGERGKKSDYFEPSSAESISDLVEKGGVRGLLLRLQALGKKQSSYLRSLACEACGGSRLRSESLQFRIDEKNISEVSSMSLSSLKDWLSDLSNKLTQREQQIATELLREISTRVDLLLDLGLHYLQLNRPMGSLSGGEAQRIRLATQIGNQLVGVMYILDEPSIGLHARDNHRLIKALKKLRDMGNTVLVVEHDKEMMLESDYLIDMGPGAGTEGGKIVAAGRPSKVLQSKTLTAKYLNGQRQVPRPLERRQHSKGLLELIGARGHNLKNFHLRLPLGRMICMTGVSGSGKSTLVHDTLVPILKKRLYRSLKEPLPYDELRGEKQLDKVIEVDQRPIGRTPRSNPATYTGVFTDIRAFFAQLPESRLRGYGPGRFSFNVQGGRCENCQGGGLRVIEMDFLPDVYVPCERCLSKRYNDQTLEVRYKGCSISDVLEMSVNKAVLLFEGLPRIQSKIRTLESVGLGYLSLGQHATTLSGGEAQRIKLASELLRRDTGHTLYVLDEPTTGLHFEDIKHLLDVLQQLVDKGNTVLIIEHNMEVIAACDYIIDLGPEGGEKGGEIVDQGTPEEVAARKNGPTGKYLAKEIKLLVNDLDPKAEK